MRNFWNSKLNKFTTLLLLSCPLVTLAQFSKPEIQTANDSEKYIYPINPGQPGSLAGNMGELRTTHFHSGIDIRTNNMIGFPVHASKSGYISRITMTPTGYGNIVYIAHPDGNTTLYAHLNEFTGALADYVRQEQYKRKTFDIDLYFTKDQFPVKQGDVIALSGNTGSSGGPHVHFDIRDSNNYALDPLKVAGFKEVAENLPPTPEKIALITLDKDARINDRFGRYEFYAGTRSGSNYAIASPILACGTIGVEILAKDKMSAATSFYGGVNYIEMRVDSQLVFSQAIEKLDITETRAIYTVMDFKTMRNKGTRFYKLYIDDGNTLKFYGKSPGPGKITVNPNKDSRIDITLRDSHGNSSVITFKLRPVKPVKEVKTLEPLTVPLTYDINDNTMTVAAKPYAPTTNKAKIYVKGTVTEVEPDYSNQNRAVYLIDLRKALPDSIVAAGQTVITNLRQAVPSGTEYKYYSDNLDIQFPAQALYDTLYLNASSAIQPNGSEVFSIGDRTVPLHKSITIAIRPQQQYSEWTRNLGIYRTAGRGYAYVDKGEVVNGRILFNTRDFGDFTILSDIVPPTIRVVNADQAGARFKIRDELSGIGSFEASINGQWLLMHYDAKTATIWSEQLDKKAPLKGELQLIVTDNAGNQSKFTKKIP